MSRSSRRAPTRSSLVVQQTQPLPSRTVCSSTRRKRWWSSPTSPNSLTRTAVLAIDGAASTLARRVVLPLPRKPVTTVTGRLVSLSPTALSVMRRGQRLAQSRVQGVRRPACQLGRRRPEGAEILDELRSPFAISEHVFAPAPVLYPKPVVTYHLVCQDHPVSAVATPVAL